MPLLNEFMVRRYKWAPSSLFWPIRMGTLLKRPERRMFSGESGNTVPSTIGANQRGKEKKVCGKNVESNLRSRWKIRWLFYIYKMISMSYNHEILSIRHFDLDLNLNLTVMSIEKNNKIKLTVISLDFLMMSCWVCLLRHSTMSLPSSVEHWNLEPNSAAASCGVVCMNWSHKAFPDIRMARWNKPD